MHRYFEVAGRSTVLVTSFIATVVLLAVFPAIPVGGELLDVRNGYGYEEALAALAGYGADGRHLYAWASATLDTLLPIAYATLLAGIAYRFRPTERLRVLAWLPVALGVLDLGENAQIITMLVQYPDVSEAQVASASAFTVTKTLRLRRVSATRLSSWYWRWCGACSLAGPRDGVGVRPDRGCGCAIVPRRFEA